MASLLQNTSQKLVVRCHLSITRPSRGPVAVAAPLLHPAAFWFASLSVSNARTASGSYYYCLCMVESVEKQHTHTHTRGHVSCHLMPRSASATEMHGIRTRTLWHDLKYESHGLVYVMDLLCLLGSFWVPYLLRPRQKVMRLSPYSSSGIHCINADTLSFIRIDYYEEQIKQNIRLFPLLTL